MKKHKITIHAVETIMAESKEEALINFWEDKMSKNKNMESYIDGILSVK